MSATLERSGSRWRDFNFLWFGQTGGTLGRELGSLAIAVACVTELDATATEIGIVSGARYLPFVVLFAPAGALVDRVSRRALLIVSDLGQATLMAVIAATLLTGSLAVPALVGLVFVAGCCEMTFTFAYRAILVDLVRPSDLMRANSKLSFAESSAEAGGPGAGAVVLAHVGAAGALWSNVLCHIAALMAIARIRPVRQTSRPATRDQTAWGALATLRDPVLRAFAGEAATYNFLWRGVTTLLALFVIQDLGLPPAAVGLMLAASGVGAAGGALLAGWVAPKVALSRSLLIGAVVADLAPLALVFAPPGDHALAVILPFLFVQGIGITLCNVNVYSSRQVIVPSHLMGRATSAYAMVSQGAMMAGGLGAGVLADAIGVRATVSLACVGLCTTWLWLAFSPLRHTRSVHDLPVIQPHSQG